jgi:hypothetical protein
MEQLLITNMEEHIRNIFLSKIKDNDKLSLEPIFYTYILLDTRIKGNFIYGNYTFEYEPFYVGKGKGTRDLEHSWEASCVYKKIINENLKINKKNFPYVNKHKITKILAIRRKTHDEHLIIRLQENIIESEALQLEIELIATIGRYDKKRGPLTNHTDGGDGAYNADGSKKVIRYDLSLNEIERFDSLKQAYLITGINDGFIGAVCLNKIKTAGGNFWRFETDEESVQNIDKDTYFLNGQGIPVIKFDLNMNQIQRYNSGREAAKILGISAAAICNACNGKQKTVKGFLWCYEKDIESFMLLNEKHFKRNNTREVIKFDLNMNELERYTTITEAGLLNNTSISSIVSVCKYESITARNFKWRYANDTDIYRKRDRKQIISKNSKEVAKLDFNLNELNKYPSLSIAAKENGLEPSVISNVCNGRGKRAGHYRWCFSKDLQKLKETELPKIENNKIYKLDMNCNILEQFNSIKDASLSMGINDSSSIRKACNGKGKRKVKSVKGFKWCYCKDYEFFKLKVFESKKPTYPVTHLDKDMNILNKFKSISEAGKILNLDSGCIMKVCKGEFSSIKGNVFRFTNNTDEYIPFKQKTKKLSVVKISLNLQEIIKFDSIREASLTNRVCNSSITSACKGNVKTAGNFFWCYENNLESFLKKEKQLQRQNYIVRLDMNFNFIAEYTNVTEAHNDTKVRCPNILLTCKNKQAHAGGFKWMYLKDYESMLKQKESA